MPYDPTLPANGSPIVSAELRNQFAGLKDLIDAVPASSAMTEAIAGNSAGPCGGFEYPDLTFSDPPTQAEVQALNNKLEAVLSLLKRV